MGSFITRTLTGLALLATVSGCIAPPETGNDVSFARQTQEPATDIGDEELWVVMQSHLHTTGEHDCANQPLEPNAACYSAEGIEAFLDAALDYGASDMLITDHNNIDAWFDPAFAPKASEDGERYATPLRGSEWSSGEGHMTLFFPRQVVSSNDEAFDKGLLWAAGNHSDDPTAQEYTETIETVHEHGGLVVINHPQLIIHPFDENTYGADAVEVGVKLKPVLQSTSSTRLWWHRRLVEADRVTAMAGADHHHGAGDVPFTSEPIFGVAVNLVRVDPRLPYYDDAAEAVADPQGAIDMRSDLAADAIGRGHVMVVEDLHTPRAYIGADTDRDGRYHDARAGDCIANDAFDGDTVAIRIRVKQAELEEIGGHYNVKLYTPGSASHSWFYVELDPEDGFEESEHYVIDQHDRFAIELEVPVDRAAPGFVRVEIEHDLWGPYNDAKTITNPIYFGAWGDECTGSAPL
jgi:hypothetical protein